MSYTRFQWANDFLKQIGNSNPLTGTVDWVVNWTAAEGGAVGGQGNFNLLNTEQQMPGSTFFNHTSPTAGVQNFVSYSQGVQANALVLQNGLYPDLLNALRTNDFNALGFNKNAPSSGVMSNLSTWCGGCAYGKNFSANPLSQYLSQQFPGTPSSTTSPGSNQTPGTNPTTSTNPGGSSQPAGQSPTPSLFQIPGLTTQADVTSFIQRFFLVSFGGMLILIGIMVLFFGSKQGQEITKETVETAATA